MFKKIIALFISFIMLMCIIGCGEKADFKADPNDFSLDFGDAQQSTTDEDTSNEDNSFNSINNSSKDQTSNGKPNSSKVQNSSSKTSGTVSEDYIDGYTSSTSSSTSSDTGSGEAVTYIELPSLENVNKLSNSLNILKSGKELKVVYFGGSVTSGTGSTDAANKSWRALTTKYLKTLGKVSDVNKAIGGTGSYLGVSRFEKDVIAEKPDLVFIEFLINDGYSAIPKEISVKNLEYMIRTLNKQNPKVDIVITLITEKTSCGTKGERYEKFCSLADHYDIPCVDLGTGFFNHVKGKTNRWMEFFADSVHPNNKGHKVYADVMQEALVKLLVDGNTSAHNLPALFDKNSYSSVTNILADKTDNLNKNDWGIGSWYSSETYENPGTQFRSSHIRNYYPNYIYPKSAGASLTFKFTGNSFGLLGNIKDGSSLTVVLDGKTTVKVNGVSKSELLEYPVFADLENKEHTVTITANGNPPYLSIASFVVGK